nr:hypothetical protein [Tanacetum cinerariifolium]
MDPRCWAINPHRLRKNTQQDLGEAEMIPVSQLEYFRAIGCLMYAMISTRPDIAFAVGKLSSGYPSVIEGYSDASWINNMEDHSSTSAGNEAEWLTNLIYEIPLGPKPISTIFIRCDSVVTLAKAYSQVYNGKSRHLADHITKGLARDLVRKAAIGMGLKSTVHWAAAPGRVQGAEPLAGVELF